jgi:NAD-dependent DNA ligase
MPVTKFRRRERQWLGQIALALALRWWGLAPMLCAAEPPEARTRITELRNEIARHDAAYHRNAAPEITDAEYDALRRHLTAWEEKFPEVAASLAPLPDIGDDRTGRLKTFRHRERMLSLEKAYTEADLQRFHGRLQKLARGDEDLAYVVEPKFDGLAVSVTFEGGRLVRASPAATARKGMTSRPTWSRFPGGFRG